MRTNESDSLDLLLDTISNVFGGVVLMAILIALQVGVATERSAVAPEGPSAAEAMARLELQRAQRELEQARALQPGSEEELVLIAKRKKEFLAAISESQARLKEEEQAQKADQWEKTRLERESTRLAKSRASTEAAINNAKAALGAAKRAPRQKVRLPYRHASRAPGQFSILISKGEVFMLPRDCVSVPLSTSPGAKLWRPIPGRGRAPSASVLGESLLGVRPSAAMVSFWVGDTNSSFEAFQKAKDAVLELGFDYSVGHFPESVGLATSPGRPEAE